MADERQTYDVRAHVDIQTTGPDRLSDGTVERLRVLSTAMRDEAERRARRVIALDLDGPDEPVANGEPFGIGGWVSTSRLADALRGCCTESGTIEHAEHVIHRLLGRAPAVVETPHDPDVADSAAPGRIVDPWAAPPTYGAPTDGLPRVTYPLTTPVFPPVRERVVIHNAKTGRERTALVEPNGLLALHDDESVVDPFPWHGDTYRPLEPTGKAIERAWDRARESNEAEAQQIHEQAGCECSERPWCAPHLRRSGFGAIGGCEPHDHVYASWTHKADEAPAERAVDASELEKDRAEQLIAALATSIRAYFPDGITVVRQSGSWAEAIARGLLNHPYVRKALEPARAMVFAEPLGEIVSFRYREDSGLYGKATHLIVRLEPGVTVGADELGKKVAVVK